MQKGRGMTTALPTVRPDTASKAQRSTDRIRVATVPSSHVYVRHLSPVDDQDLPRVVRLPDPDPDEPGRYTQSKWWPPMMLQPEWVRAHADEFDVFHLQFGFDACPPARLEEVVETLRAAGKPLVYTVHDLRNPHHMVRDEHDAQLDVLIPAADALITLTRGAAGEIESRWGRRPVVLPHPHVVDLDVMERMGARPHDKSRPFTVGLHVKSLRACMDPLAVLPALTRAVQEIPGAVLQVNGHRDVLEPDGARFNPTLARALELSPPVVAVRVHDFFSDAQLWDYLGRLDVSVLPYRFGTHSGWLEACRDIGTAVAAPTCGYYQDQAPVFAFGMDEAGLDESSLIRAIRQAYDASPAEALSVDERVAQRQCVAAAHVDLYRELLA
jgi:beta-1,4-mannosyltransferase